MAVTLPTDCYWQPDERVGRDASGASTRVYSIKGPFTGLKTLLDGLDVGDVVTSGWTFSSGDLQRRPGNLGVLSLNCLPVDTTSTVVDGETVTSQKALDETWTLKSVRNDVSILAYCGPSAENPSREDIEAWQKEPDGTLARNNQYKTPDDVIVTLGTDEIAVINKIRKGIDSVMRFYPMLTKTRTYSTPPLSVYENLATIDTPTIGDSSTSDRLQKPGNLSAIISAHTWLKCQDDCALLPDGKFQRIESWMGVRNADGSGWDQDLYGTANRWTMPLSISDV